ncbi:unnamed protein product [Prorocentrum cordatum]|uniref:Glycosyltransferase family 92 protein n=1 Tax=Prorocentrum cordatum TaxID=2364126 RepID=A0ABN9TZX0_9DINO|nr:unnamed protein product [Polarella glacialis]
MQHDFANACSLVPAGGSRAALVSTLRDVGDQLLVWAEWFRIIGFAHLFLYFDDPVEDASAIEEALGIYSAEFLSVVCSGPGLRSEWRSLRSWGDLAEFADDRMCRQLLNIAHCVRRCTLAAPGSPEAVDWLFHLDHDELFVPPAHGLQAHLRHLEEGRCELCLYENFEAVPEDHTLAPFLDVTLFKVPAGRVPKTPLGERGMQRWARRTQAGTYFLYYDNGKSAARVRRDGEPFAPRSVHLLVRDATGEVERLRGCGAAWSTYPESELLTMDLGFVRPQSDEVVAGAKVLHYPATHHDRLFRKYDHLKDFPAVRFGGGIVVPPSFHLEARDCYVRHLPDGEEAQRRQLRELTRRKRGPSAWSRRGGPG